jgi:hypothetical protein
MSINTHFQSIHSKPIVPRGPSLETWLSRQFLMPPATAAVIAEHAGFRRHDDWGAAPVPNAQPAVSRATEGRRNA